MERQHPKVFWGDRVCVCARPELQRVVVKCFSLNVCLACGSAFLRERKVARQQLAARAGKA